MITQEGLALVLIDLVLTNTPDMTGLGIEQIVKNNLDCLVAETYLAAAEAVRNLRTCGCDPRGVRWHAPGATAHFPLCHVHHVELFAAELEKLAKGLAK